MVASKSRGLGYLVTPQEHESTKSIECNGSCWLIKRFQGHEHEHDFGEADLAITNFASLKLEEFHKVYRTAYKRNAIKSIQPNEQGTYITFIDGSSEHAVNPNQAAD